MHLLNLSELPKSGIRFIHRFFNPQHQSFRESLECITFRKIQSLVDEKRKETDQHLSIHIILNLEVRIITYSYRLITNIAFKVEVVLFDVLLACYGVKWLHSILIAHQDILDIVEIALEFVKVPKLIECFQGVIRIPKPAVPIVPGTRAAMMLRQACSA